MFFRSLPAQRSPERSLGSDTTKEYYFHYDALGSVVALSDSAGNTAETYRYDIFGTANNTGSVGNPYFFTGRRYDPETSLYYYRARIYNPMIGRFLQTDPVGYGDGMNMYAYVGNSPIVLTDPLGLCSDTPSLGDRQKRVVDTTVVPQLCDPRMIKDWERHKGSKSEKVIEKLLHMSVEESMGQTGAMSALTITYSTVVNEVATKVGDAVIGFHERQGGPGYSKAYLEVQEYEYSRKLIFGRKWKAVGDSHFLEVTGGEGWEPGLELYLSEAAAQEAAGWKKHEIYMRGWGIASKPVTLDY